MHNPPLLHLYRAGNQSGDSDKEPSGCVKIRHDHVQMSSTAMVLVLMRGVFGLDNGLALTPPMGWRSWNCYHGSVDAVKIQDTIDAITSRSRTIEGKHMSLADIGYQHVGVDDGWQACKTGKDCSFHTATGTPLVNKSKFPDLKALVDHGNGKGIKVGWYQINCICCDEFIDTGNLTWKKNIYAADVKQLVDAGFHGVKLDDCGDGSGAGLLERVAAINASGHAMLIENSNQGVGGPGTVHYAPNSFCTISLYTML